MVFPQPAEDPEKQFYRTDSMRGSKVQRPSERGIRPVSVSKKELASKLTKQTLGNVSKHLTHETSFDQLLRE